MKKPEASRVGLWIDHARAYLVTVGNESATVRCLESEVEGRHKTQGGFAGNPVQHQVGGASHKKFEKRRLNHMVEFYRQVIDAVKDVDEVAVFGPGLAKQELNSEIKKKHQVAEKVVAVETAEKMTEPQLVAMIKKFFKDRDR